MSAILCYGAAFILDGTNVDFFVVVLNFVKIFFSGSTKIRLLFASHTHAYIGE